MTPRGGGYHGLWPGISNPYAGLSCLEEQMRTSHLQMGSPASVCWVGATYLQSLGNTEESRLMWSFLKKIHRCFHFVCPFVFNTPHIYHSSWVRRFSWHVENLDSVPSTPSSPDWLKNLSSAPFPTVSLRTIREGLHCKKAEVSSLATTANGSGWSFFSAVHTGTRHHISHKNLSLPAQVHKY